MKKLQFEIKNLEVKLIDNKFVNFTIFKNENKIIVINILILVILENAKF